MKFKALLLIIASPIWVPLMMLLWLAEFAAEQMGKTRSVIFMALITFLVGGTMYGVAAREEMTEERLAAEMTQALQEDREAQTLAAALFAESHYRARVEVRP